MAVAVRLPLVVETDPKCCPVLCDYRPSRIRKAMRLMDELAQSGIEPCESIMAALMREMEPENVIGENPYERDASSFGPVVPTGAGLVADIWRAMRAGKRDPMSIAKHLCPWALTSIDEM